MLRCTFWICIGKVELSGTNQTVGLQINKNSLKHIYYWMKKKYCTIKSTNFFGWVHFIVPTKKKLSSCLYSTCTCLNYENRHKSHEQFQFYKIEIKNWKKWIVVWNHMYKSFCLVNDQSAPNVYVTILILFIF